MANSKTLSVLKPSGWLFATLAAVVVCLAVFVLNALLGDIRSGNVWGLSYGAAATVLLLVAGVYGARRRVMRLAARRRLGRASVWLPVHTFTGTLFLLLVLMHSGFRLPEGWVTWGLWLLSFWTVLSGFFGLALQRWIPRRLTSGLSIEVHFDRIPELVDESRSRAEKLAAESSEAVRGFYERRLAEAFHEPRWRWLYFLDVTGGGRTRLRELDFLAPRLADAERERLARLRELFVAKSEIDAHYTLQRTLRAWLYLHVPTTIVLIALLAVHLFTVAYY